jgi:O-methyltransferase domain
MIGPSPEEVVWGALRGALVTRALALAADLGVADRLADGPRPVAELASESGADPDTLHRVLRALASDGIFAEGAPGVFRNTAVSDVLRGEGGWRDFAHLFGGPWLRAIAELGADGRATFERLYSSSFWAWLAAEPAERAVFDRAMAQGFEGRLARLETVNWRGDETVVDVGGGNGSLLLALLERHPRMRGIVFDLPEAARDESSFGERCVFVPGSFFESVPPGDAYVLSTILHDWDDDSAAAILRTIRSASGEDTRLVLLEAIVEPGNDPDGSKWLDLLMLALFGGRERDEAEWRALLQAAGFAVERVGTGVIEARCR